MSDALKNKALNGDDEAFRIYTIGALDRIEEQVERGEIKFALVDRRCSDHKAKIDKDQEDQNQEIKKLHDAEERKKGAWNTIVIITTAITATISVAVHFIFKKLGG